MAYGDTKAFNYGATDGQMVATGSVRSYWETAIDAKNGSVTGLDTADASTVTNPDTQCATSTHHILQRRGRGTNVALSIKYPAGSATTTAWIGGVMGRDKSSGKWRRLYNKNGDLEITITPDTANDASDGTYQYTPVHPLNHIADCFLYDELVFFTEQALNLASTDEQSASLEVAIF